MALISAGKSLKRIKIIPGKLIVTAIVCLTTALPFAPSESRAQQHYLDNAKRFLPSPDFVMGMSAIEAKSLIAKKFNQWDVRMNLAGRPNGKAFEKKNPAYQTSSIVLKHDYVVGDNHNVERYDLLFTSVSSDSQLYSISRRVDYVGSQPDLRYWDSSLKAAWGYPPAIDFQAKGRRVLRFFFDRHRYLDEVGNDACEARINGISKVEKQGIDAAAKMLKGLVEANCLGITVATASSENGDWVAISQVSTLRADLYLADVIRRKSVVPDEAQVDVSNSR